MRLKPSFRWSVYAAFAVLFLTGAGWLVADWQKEFSTGEAWQQTAAYLLMVHGGAAMATLLLLGALIPLHALRAWPELFRGRQLVLRIDPGFGLGHHEKVRTGGKQAKFGLSADALYYLGSETLRPWMSWIHIAAGCLLALWFPVHIVWGRRKLR